MKAAPCWRAIGDWRLEMGKKGLGTWSLALEGGGRGCLYTLGRRASWLPGGETVFDDCVVAPWSSARCIGLEVRVVVGSR